MHIIGIILIGLIAGILAKLLHPGRENMGFIMTTLLGIAGSVIATFLGRAIGLYRPGDSAGFIASVIGAIVILVIYGSFKRRHAAI